jgi:hypothetical protein
VKGRLLTHSAYGEPIAEHDRELGLGDVPQPPEIRTRLLKLHATAMAVVNDGSQHRATEMFNLAIELEDEAADMLEAVTRLYETLSTLTALRPDSLDANGGEVVPSVRTGLRPG